MSREVGCDFCSKESKPIVLDTIMIKDNHLVLYTENEWDLYDFHEKRMLPINYCLICGRKLMAKTVNHE